MIRSKKKFRPAILISAAAVIIAVIAAALCNFLPVHAELVIPSETVYTNSEYIMLESKQYSWEHHQAVLACADSKGYLKYLRSVSVSRGKDNKIELPELADTPNFALYVCLYESNSEVESFDLASNYKAAGDKVETVCEINGNKMNCTFERINIVYDTEAPVLNRSDIEYTINNNSCTITVNHDNDDVKEYEFTANYTRKTSDNTVTFYDLDSFGNVKVTLIDNAGNRSKTMEVKIEKEAPDFDVTVSGVYKGSDENPNGDFYASAELKVVTKKDYDEKLFYCFEPQKDAEYKSVNSYIVDKNGKYTVRIKDTHGNVRENEVEVNIINEAPTVKFDKSADQYSEYTNDKEMKVLFSVEDKTGGFNASDIMVTMGKTALTPKCLDMADDNSRATFEAVITNKVGTAYNEQLKVSVVDKGGIESSAVHTILYDGSAPVVDKPSLSTETVPGDDGKIKDFIGTFTIPAKDTAANSTGNIVESGLDDSRFDVKLANEEYSMNELDIQKSYDSSEQQYIVKVTVHEGSYLCSDFIFTVFDKAGNTSEAKFSEAEFDVKGPDPTNVIMAHQRDDETVVLYDIRNGNNEEGAYLKEGDIIRILVEANDLGIGFGEKSGAVIKFEDIDSLSELALDCTETFSDDKTARFEKTLKIIDGKLTDTSVDPPIEYELTDNSVFKLAKIEVKDDIGNSTSISAEKNLNYYASLVEKNLGLSFDVYRFRDEDLSGGNDNLDPQIKSQRYRNSIPVYGSDDRSDKVVNKGEIIRIGFESDHEFESKNAAIRIISGDKEYVSKTGIAYKTLNRYNFYFTVDADIDFDNCEIIPEMSLFDKARNTFNVSGFEKADVIRYYAPLDEVVKFDSTGIYNADGTVKNGSYIKNDEKFFARFSFTHPVKVDFGAGDAVIAGERLSASNYDEDEYSAEISRVITSGSSQLRDNEEITYRFRFSDDSRNGKVEFDNESSGLSEIIYLEPIKASDVQMRSDNNLSDGIVKNGNKITISFKSNHQVSLISASIAGREASFTSDDNINWIAEAEVTDGYAEDLENVVFTVSLGDKAGNTVLKLTEKDSDKQIKYYAPVVITNLAILGSNANDGRKYAKDGDEIKVSFTANHKVDISNATLCDKPLAVSSSNGEGSSVNYVLSYTLKTNDTADQSVLAFRFEASDDAENRSGVITNGSVEEINSIVYYAPITAEASISSGNRNKSYVNNGGRITVSGKANHGVSVTTGEIMGRTPTILGRNSDTYSLNYTIDENESELPEGKMSFSYSLSDLAGNTLSIDAPADGSSVTYDRTLPIIKSEYTKASFTNHSVSYKFKFSDLHLAPNDISVKVNGVEQITDSERLSITGTEFVKEITLDSDNDYHIVVSAKDLANNDAASGFENRITVDKTDPEIKTISLRTDKPEIYKGQFVIKDHFEFSDANLKEVICTITTSNGTQEWDINEPITVDGKNSLYLMAVDMADNTSSAFVYDFYIDGTPPKFIVLETKSGTYMKSDETAVFKIEADLKISLEALHIEGISEPDKFEKLYITDADGNMIEDLLAEAQLDPSAYTVSLKKAGDYILCAQAKDSVDNSTGIVKYPFTIKSKSAIGRFLENKPAVAATATGIGVLIFAAIYLLVFRRTKKR